MNGDVWVLLAQGTDEPVESRWGGGAKSENSFVSIRLRVERVCRPLKGTDRHRCTVPIPHSHGSGFWLEQTCHILNGKDVDTALNELVGEVEVVLKSVLCLLGVGDVTGVAAGE